MPIENSKGNLCSLISEFKKPESVVHSLANRKTPRDLSAARGF